MAKGLVNESSLNSIGSAINVLNGTEGTYTPSEMGEAIIDAIPTETASGNPIHITDAAAYPARSVVTTLEPVQEGSGDPSPENVRPITGHTGTELTRTGKNLLPMTVDGIKTINTSGSWNGNVYTVAGIAFEILTDSALNVTGIKVNGTSTAANESIFYICFQTPFVANEYIFGCASANLNNNFRLKFRANGFFAVTTSEITRQLTEETACDAMIVVNAGYTVNNVTVNLMIRLASVSDPTFEPYQSETHSVTFPQAQSPVYGGEVDWVNGVLRVNKAFQTGTSNQIFLSGTGKFAYFTPDDTPKIPPSQTDVGEIICSEIKSVSRNYTDNAISNGVSIADDGKIHVRNGAYSTKEEYTSWINNGTWQTCYTLATPIEIPLTPEVITLLKGENNVWTDAGTSEIEYKVDLQSYIQKLIDEASGTASALSVSPLALGKSAVLTSTDGENADEIEETDEPLAFDEEVKSEPIEEDTEAKPIESEIRVKEPDTLEKEGGDTV